MDSTVDRKPPKMGSLQYLTDGRLRLSGRGGAPQHAFKAILGIGRVDKSIRRANKPARNHSPLARELVTLLGPGQDGFESVRFSIVS